MTSNGIDRSKLDGIVAKITDSAVCAGCGRELAAEYDLINDDYAILIGNKIDEAMIADIENGHITIGQEMSEYWGEPTIQYFGLDSKGRRIPCSESWTPESVITAADAAITEAQ